MINEIEGYIESCPGRDFSCEQASHIVRKLGELFLSIDANAEEDRYVCKPEFIVQFVVDVCKCSINMFIGNSKEVVCTVINRQLFECFKSQEPKLKKVLSRNSIYDIDGLSLQEYVPYTLTKDDLSFDFKFRIPIGKHATEHETESLTFAITKCKEIVEEIKQRIDESSSSGNDFDSRDAADVTNTLKRFFTSMNDSNLGFSFKPKFQIKFSVYVCKCAANEFIKHKEYYQSNFHPLAGIRKKESEMLILFKNMYKGQAENTAVDWIFADILKWIQKFIATNLGCLIKNQISQQQQCCLNKKQNFFAQILVDLGAADQLGFQSYLKYLNG